MIPHSRLIRIQPKIDNFNITKMSLKTKKLRKSFKRKLQDFAYVSIGVIIMQGVIIKVSYDFLDGIRVQASQGIVSPAPAPTPEPVIKEVIVKDEDIDTWVRDYINQYFSNASQRSEMKMIMHCLLNRESQHGLDQGHGDSGMAGGPLQYWEQTWESYRSQMVSEGQTAEIGSRYDMKEAIHTTVWAIKNGKGLAWGPLLRDSHNNHNASCPTPSFY